MRALPCLAPLPLLDGLFSIEHRGERVAFQRRGVHTNVARNTRQRGWNNVHLVDRIGARARRWVVRA